MKVSEAKFTRRYNVAQYEHEEYSLTAIVEDDENAVEVLSQLKADVEAAKKGEPAEDSGNSSKTAQTKSSKTSKKVKEKPESTEESSEEETGAEDTEAEDSETDSKPEKGTKDGKKAKKKKTQAYDRNNDTHKQLFTGLLTEVSPGWKKSDESKEKAKKVSMKMEGQDFLDNDGEILEDFKAATKKAMAKK